MIYSMTAFTRQSIQKEWGTATIELRALNHRYLELDFRLPEVLRELESSMREQAIEYLHRGKVECHLKYKPAESSTQHFFIDKPLVQQLARTSAEIHRLWEGEITTSLSTILNWPGVLQAKEFDKEILVSDISVLFKSALIDLVELRLREGNALAKRIEQRLDQVLSEVEKIKQRLPLVLTQQRQKILARIEEFKLTIEPHRLEEELLLLMQKMDVSEEVERLEIHVEEVRSALNASTAVGRRLDFLMQELHREANTLGSKSSDAEVTHSAIHLKVLIEQMREQVQNIE